MEASSTDKRIDELASQVGRFEGRFERFEDRVESCFDRVDHRFERLEDKIDARFAKWDKIVTAVGVSMAGGVVSIAGAVVYKVLGL